MQAGRFDSVVVTEELKTANLLRLPVGSKRDKLMATSNGQSVLNVCREFGKFVRYVELRDAQLPPPVTASNAFAVMTTAQKRLIYYSCGFEPICIKCSSEDVQSNTDFFPLCVHCVERGTSPTPRSKRKS